jgi:hypothetical protein
MPSVPTQRYGFSDNALGALGPPSFADVALTLDGSDRAISIALVYHGGGQGAGHSDEPMACSSASR